MIYSSRNSRDVKACIYDSPYSDLQILIKQIASQTTGIPGFVFSMFFSGVDEILQSKVGTSLKEYEITRYAKTNEVAGLFLASEADSLVKHNHTVKLFNEYSGSKQLFFIQQKHQQNRPLTLIRECVQYAKTRLRTHRSMSRQLLFQEAQFEQQYETSYSIRSRKISRTRIPESYSDVNESCLGSRCLNTQIQSQFGSGRLNEYDEIQVMKPSFVPNYAKKSRIEQTEVTAINTSIDRQFPWRR